MRVFADDGKLAEFVRELPDHPDKWLMYASGLVAKATRAALYDVDPSGMPTDPDVIDAMAAATCLQVAEWQAAGLDPVAGVAGQGETVTSTSMEGASFSFESDAAVKTMSLTQLCDLSMTVLEDAGLTGGQPWVQ